MRRTKATLPPRSRRRRPQAWGIWASYGQKTESRIRDQSMRAAAPGRRGGACGDLGFTSPHCEVGGELRPREALGAESHPRLQPKPQVIFNQRRSRDHHPATHRARITGRTNLPAFGENPGVEGPVFIAPPPSRRFPGRKRSDAKAHAELGGGGALQSQSQPIL